VLSNDNCRVPTLLDEYGSVTIPIEMGVRDDGRNSSHVRLSGFSLVHIKIIQSPKDLFHASSLRLQSSQH
jgi:hypothetical protein